MKGHGRVNPPARHSATGGRPFPLFYVFLSLIGMTILHFALPGTAVAPFPWNFLGLIPLLLGVALNLAADRVFRGAGTTVKPFQVSTVLLTTGVFRISRNPMYLGMLLILLGVALLMGSSTPFVLVILFGILVDALFIEIEERMLAERFGESWVAYRAKVRRWL
jgi:protein-S-isoprenylcysteine O-methyltransferase Ste14